RRGVGVRPRQGDSSRRERRERVHPQGGDRGVGGAGAAAARADEHLAARGGSLPSPKRAEPARLLRCSSVKYGEYSPSSRLAAGPAAPISARSDFHHGLLGRPTPGVSVGSYGPEKSP